MRTHDARTSVSPLTWLFLAFRPRRRACYTMHRTPRATCHCKLAFRRLLIVPGGDVVPRAFFTGSRRDRGHCKISPRGFPRENTASVPYTAKSPRERFIEHTHTRWEESPTPLTPTSTTTTTVISTAQARAPSSPPDRCLDALEGRIDTNHVVSRLLIFLDRDIEVQAAGISDARILINFNGSRARARARKRRYVYE